MNRTRCIQASIVFTWLSSLYSWICF